MVNIIKVKDENTEEKLRWALSAYSLYQIEDKDLFEHLFTSNVWVPCLLELEEKDYPFVMDILENKRYKDYDLHPYLIQVEELEKGFYACFSKHDFQNKEIDDHFTWLYLPFTEYLKMVENKKDASGVVVDPFGDQVAIPFELVDELLKVSKDTYYDLTTDFDDDKQKLFDMLRQYEVPQAYFCGCNSLFKEEFRFMVLCDKEVYEKIEKQLPTLGLKANPVILDYYQNNVDAINEFHIAPFYSPDYPSLPKYRIVDLAGDSAEVFNEAIKEYENEDSDEAFEKVFRTLEQASLWIPANCFLYDEQIEMFEEDFLKDPEKYQPFFTFYNLMDNNKNAFFVFSSFDLVPDQFKNQFTWLHITYFDMIKVLHYHPKFQMLLLDNEHANFVIERKHAVDIVEEYFSISNMVVHNEKIEKKLTDTFRRLNKIHSAYLFMPENREGLAVIYEGDIGKNIVLSNVRRTLKEFNIPVYVNPTRNYKMKFEEHYEPFYKKK